MNRQRIFKVIEGKKGNGPVVYWMSRDQRVFDNWALIHAYNLALERKSPLAVAFCLIPDFLNARARQYKFMLDGLRDVRKNLLSLNIPFLILKGSPGELLPVFLNSIRAGAVIADFDPLRIKRQWRSAVAASVDIEFLEVDAHNIVPCRIASNKQEFAAYTFRPKIKRLLPEYLDGFTQLERFPFNTPEFSISLQQSFQEISHVIDADIDSTEDIISGEEAAHSTLRHFISKKLQAYPDGRNDPNAGATSGLSPYLHFGQISAQRIALEVQKSDAPDTAKEAFLEELIVRRELSDNYCFYNENYDNFDGFPEWARKTLNEHRKDKREYLYTIDDFENAKTHDALWNASQKELLFTGKMHGYMRMYWAKKIHEWTPSPEEALQAAIYLNDKYQLDGRDPNGYTGIGWSIGGLHDRAWGERPVFGKIRYMNLSGAKRKFDVNQYISRFLGKE